MNKLKITAMEIPEQSIVAVLIKSLYHEDDNNSNNYMTNEKIENTFKRAANDPEHLKIDVFKVEDIIVGYAMVFIFWSNEYGGLIFNIDELYISPEFRSHGIATTYLNQFFNKNISKAGLSLEVMSGNEKALKLYNRLGFSDTGRRHLIKLL